MTSQLEELLNQKSLFVDIQEVKEGNRNITNNIYEIRNLLELIQNNQEPQNNEEQLFKKTLPDSISKSRMLTATSVGTSTHSANVRLIEGISKKVEIEDVYSSKGT